MERQLLLLAAICMVSGCAALGSGRPGPGGAAGEPGAVSLSGGDRRVAATIMSALNGGLIGGQAGAGLSSRQRNAALEAEYRALEYTQAGQPVAWGEQRSGTHGQVVAGPPYRVGSQDCRQYTQTAMVDGRSQSARGTACRNPDGSWALLN